MQKYALGEVYQALESWPFDNPASDYRILRGEPKASGRMDSGSNEGQHRLGIWSCTAGAFECTELGDELQTIVSGRLSLTRVGGETIDCGPGDSIFTRKGERVIWDVHEDVTKVFYTYNRDGAADEASE